MSELCFRILPIVRDMWGGPDEIGGGYVAAVASDTALPAYFRAIEQAAACPDRAKALFRFWEVYDQDAQMILRAGLVRLRRDRRLSRSERATVLAMLRLENEAVYGPQHRQ